MSIKETLLRPRNLSLVIAAVVLVVIVAVAILLPTSSRTMVQIQFDAPIESVWEVYTDYGSQANWRADVEKVEMGIAQGYWTETTKSGGLEIDFEVLEENAPGWLVLKMRAEGSFEGRYIAEFKPRGTGTVGTFTEEATYLNPIANILRLLFVDQEEFIRTYAQEAQAEIRRRAIEPEAS
ncbi:MAG: SRPBCC family protein [Gammaproteobacteria bacterium]|nr:SRPBCC family protein [Gammaproteobacteria bacterium]